MKVLEWAVLTLSLCAYKWVVSVPVTPPTAAATPETPSVSPTVDESARLVDWLMKYGYLPPPDPSTGQLQAWTAVTQALKAMQRFAGLHDSGALDEETLRLIQSPRCSLPDDESRSQIPESYSDLDTKLLGVRMKREVSSWAQRNINWRLRMYPPSSPLSHEMFRSLVFYALKVWAEPTALEFHEVGGPEGADLLIDFLHGSHGDDYPFDGAGGAVGHAFFPSDPERAGEVHLDAGEEWAFRQPASEGTDAFTVLVHELGHALGLSHSSVRGSVMRPYYQGPLGDPLHFSLGSSDQEHITALYGKRGDHPQTDSPALNTDAKPNHQRRGTHRLTHMHRQTNSHLDSPVDRCNTSFDAVAKIRGEMFFFKGLSMWRVNRGSLVSRRAVSVQKLWAALPASLPPLSAVLERHEDHAIIFISGSHFWLFKDLSLQKGFPLPLSALNSTESDSQILGVHWNPDKGIVWGTGEEGGGIGVVWTELLEGGVNGIIPEADDHTLNQLSNVYRRLFNAEQRSAQLSYKLFEMFEKLTTLNSTGANLTITTLKNISVGYSSNHSSAQPFLSLLPYTHLFLPHLRKNPDSLQPRIFLSQGRSEVSLVLGIPTVRRQRQSYLVNTISSLLYDLTPEQKADIIIIIFVAEIDSAFVKSVASNIEEKWRTKQILDYSYLMLYAQDKGKLFRASDLPTFVEFFLMFYKDKPIDWLLDHILWVKGCNPEKDSNNCITEKAKLKRTFKPSLFQHVGVHSSLPGKTQNLKVTVRKRVKQGLLSCCKPSTDGFVIIGSFVKGIAAGSIDPELRDLDAMRLFVHNTSKSWVILSEVSVLSLSYPLQDIHQKRLHV
ncbi:Matrix metalloproteinase-17 [Bagarius yarrelli]|uniref:Matrix metalloproteinase-17 n=1 Tax=Bagarius yarrelli TaxID=175774 RepID=A0A556U8Z1_BAGYA|nr:Matrix metalloproteinase-17 [Bagarius yarrelli]